MSFTQILRLLVRFAPYLVLSALLLSGTVALLTLKTKKEYKSHTLLNTGLISGYTIESSKGNRIDYAYTNNEIENLINLATSLETSRDLSARLLTELIWAEKEAKFPLLGENKEELATLMESVSEAGIRGSSKEEIYQSLIQRRDQDKTNAIYELTYSKNPLIGLERLQEIKVFREGNSDMIRMEYTSIDPFMSQKTLELLTEIFISKQKTTKEGQSDSVIKFFEEATQKTLDRLQSAEDELLKFRVKNQIINYYEQTRFIAGNREELDKKYQEQLQIKAGSESALNRLESEIKDKRALASLQNQISQNQSQIADYNFALMELNLLGSENQNPETESLKREIEHKIALLRNDMLSSTYGVMDVNKTTDGVPTQNILTQWLQALITKEESSAQLQVMDNRMKEYDQIYDRFAPLGSTLRRLESEIDVAEREYLENLHSFNQARLHKYNMLMSINLKVIDFPNYPAQAEKSKAAMLVILSFVVGLIIPSGVVIGAELVDSSLKSPKNATDQTGLKVCGLLPQYPKNPAKNPVDFAALTKQAMNLFVQELIVSAPADKKQVKVALASIHPQEGKSTLVEKVEEFIQAYYPESEGRFEFREIPSLLNNPYTQETIREADLHLVLARADRKWSEADAHALKVYRKFVGQKPLLFLTKVRTDIMEDVTGEVPRKRSWLRAKVKSLLN
jgi:polysaccharide biosynthesis transport protein